MQTCKNAPEVLIIGAGPTGLTLACDLARRGISYRIIDQQEEPSQHSKALAIHARTMECFEQLGLTDELCRRGQKIHALNLYADGRRIARIDFQHLDTPYPFVLVVPQSETERLLIERLTSLGGTVERSVRFMEMERLPDSVRATMQDIRSNQRQAPVPVSWLVGCDGAHSSVRTCLKLPFEGEHYEESFLLGDLTLEGDLPSDEGHIFLSPAGVLLAISLPDSHRYRIVIDETQDVSPQSDSDLTVQDFQDYWRERVGKGPGKTSVLSRLGWHSRFRISRRLVSSYRKGRVLLAGDAAHVHSPVGGQGMNTGIQDALNLGWKLALVSQGWSPKSLLDSYEQERRPIAGAILAGTHRGTQLITLRHPVLRWIRNHVVSFVSRSQAVQQRIVHAIAELDIQYGEAAIDRSWKRRLFSIHRFSSPTPGPAVGERAADVIFRDDHLKACRLFDLFYGTHHTLLLFSGLSTHHSSERMLKKILRLVEERYANQIRSFLVVPNADPSDPPSGNILVRDAEGTLHHRYGGERCCAYVIRPDGYVGCKSRPFQAQLLHQYLSKILFPPKNR